MNFLIQHVSHVSFEKMIIYRMVAYFKVDPDEKIWFLWCSSLRVKDPGGPKSARHFKIKEPVAVNSTVKVLSFLFEIIMVFIHYLYFKVDQDVRLLRTNLIDHPAKLFTNQGCISCDKKVIEKELVQIRYMYLIKYEEMQQRQGLKSVKNKGKIEIYDAFKVHAPIVLLVKRDVY